MLSVHSKLREREDTAGHLSLTVVPMENLIPEVRGWVLSTWKYMVCAGSVGALLAHSTSHAREETLDAVYSVATWSLNACADGRHPLAAHDGASPGDPRGLETIFV